MNWKQLALQIAVIALGSNPKTAPLVPYISQGVQHAEDIPGAKGKAKFDAAVTLAMDGVRAANALKPGLLNEAEIKATIEVGTQSVVDATNTFKHAKLIVPNAG